MIVTKTRCGRCGDIRLAQDAFTLFTDPASKAMSYRFECPYCGTRYRRHASARAASLLLTLGAVNGMPPITEREIEQFVRSMDAAWPTAFQDR